jgi:hypothetical protein
MFNTKEKQNMTKQILMNVIKGTARQINFMDIIKINMKKSVVSKGQRLAMKQK